MTKENILEKKFEELDILKEILSTYPSDYRNNIVKRIGEVSEEIISYLAVSKRALKEFTLEEVAKYNGKDGMPAYVIVNGSVYDTGDVDVWTGGVHFGILAGSDLTEVYNSCHSGKKEILGKLRLVGTLKQ